MLHVDSTWASGKNPLNLSDKRDNLLDLRNKYLITEKTGFPILKNMCLDPPVQNPLAAQENRRI